MVRLIVFSLILVGTGAMLSAGCEPNGNYARLAQGPDAGGDQVAPEPDGGDVGGSGVIVSSGGIAAVGSGGIGGRVSASGGATGQVGGIGGHASVGGGGQASGVAGTSGGTGGIGSSSGGTTGVGGGTATGGSVPGSGGVAAGTGGVTSTGGKASGGAAGGATSTGGKASGGAAGGATSTGGNGGAVQRILSIDFVGGVASGGAGGVSGTVVMAATETAGVKRAKNWNSAPGPMGTLSALALSDGSAATGASANWNAPIYTGSAGTYAIGYADTPGDVRMMNGCLNPGWTGTAPTSPVTVVSLTGLPAAITSGGYDVYVYVLGGIPDSETRSYQYTIGSTTFGVMQPGPTPTTFASPYVYTLAPNAGSGNYIVFRNVTGGAFDLRVKPSSSGTLRSPINGLQIVWPAGS